MTDNLKATPLPYTEPSNHDSSLNLKPNPLNTLFLCLVFAIVNYPSIYYNINHNYNTTILSSMQSLVHSKAISCFLKHTRQQYNHPSNISPSFNQPATFWELEIWNEQMQH